MGSRILLGAFLGFGYILAEYQFAGDAEGHGAPLTTRINEH